MRGSDEKKIDWVRRRAFACVGMRERGGDGGKDDSADGM